MLIDSDAIATDEKASERIKTEPRTNKSALLFNFLFLPPVLSTSNTSRGQNLFQGICTMMK